MKRVGEYRSYLLYEVDEFDGRDINTSSGNRYIRNSILVFESVEGNQKLGDEWRVCKDKKEAINEIDAYYQKISIIERLRQAEERSRAREECERIKREHREEADYFERKY